MTDTQTHDAAKAKAEATFRRKQEQARDGAIAMSEYISDQASLRAKTERLRAMRLAKEAQDAAAPKDAPKADKKKTARRA